jgi:hypothetical protein
MCFHSNPTFVLSLRIGSKYLAAFDSRPKAFQGTAPLFRLASVFGSAHFSIVDRSPPTSAQLDLIVGHHFHQQSPVQVFQRTLDDHYAHGDQGEANDDEDEADNHLKHTVR